MVCTGARGETASTMLAPRVLVALLCSAGVGSAIALGCAPFDSTPESRDAGTGATDAPADTGASPPDSSDGPRTGLVCTERAPRVFTTLAACEAAIAPSATDCAAKGATAPSNGAPCAAPVTWCACVESSSDVVLRQRDCDCAR